MKRTVIQYVQLTTEAEILLVSWHELQTNALILVHIDGIVYIKMVERNGSRAYWRRETLLKKVYLVIIEIDILEEILDNRIQCLACLYKF